MIRVVALLVLLWIAPAIAHNIPPEFVAAIKRSEGYSARAYWDVKQWSIGYGTRARSADEVIDEKEADRRFVAEMSAAAAFVDTVTPQLDPGTRAALASLTFNAGPSWATATLGDLIRDRKLKAARQVFLQYTRAGGRQLSGLVARRELEAGWFGQTPARARGHAGMPDAQRANRTDEGDHESRNAKSGAAWLASAAILYAGVTGGGIGTATYHDPTRPAPVVRDVVLPREALVAREDGRKRPDAPEPLLPPCTADAVLKPEDPAIEQGTVTAAELNVRQTPAGRIAGQLYRGDKVDILERRTNGGGVEWLRTPKGWVAARFVEIEGGHSP